MTIMVMTCVPWSMIIVFQIVFQNGGGSSYRPAVCRLHQCLPLRSLRLMNSASKPDHMRSIRIKDPDKIAFVVEIWIACSKTR